MALREELDVSEWYHSGVLRELNGQRTDGYLCDVILCVDGERIPAHRCVLAAASPYFHGMFEERHFLEGTTKDVQLAIDKDAAHAILKLIYLGQLSLDVSTVYGIIAAADLLLMDEAKQLCAGFLLRMVTSSAGIEENLRIRRSAQLYRLRELEAASDAVVAMSFAQVTRTAAFLELSRDEVVCLLRRDDIAQASENVFWEAAIAWIEHDRDARSSLTAGLMEVVRFPLIDPELLLGPVMQHELMARCASCTRWVNDAMKYQLLPAAQSDNQTSQTKPRCTRQQVLIYCLGVGRQFKCYVPGHNRWYSLAAPAHYDVTSGGSRTLRLLAVAGDVYTALESSHAEEVGHLVLLSLERYDIDVNEWCLCALPNQLEPPVTLIGCAGQLYACARCGVERYDSASDTWQCVASYKATPYQFAVSDSAAIHLYNLEDGTLQKIRVDNASLTQHQIMTPNRFTTDVNSVTKLPYHEVLLSLRTVGGMSRKILNIKSNLWRDANLSHGLGKTRQCQGFSSCVDTNANWKTVCDRNCSTIYMVATQSSLAGIPLGGATGTVSHDALPFLKVDLFNREWHRLASIPGIMAVGGLHLCINDNYPDEKEPNTSAGPCMSRGDGVASL